MPDIWYDVDTALAEVPVNIIPLVDDTDYKSIEGAVAYNAAGLALRWHFVTCAGAYTVTSVTPTTGGAYDWTDQGDSGIYTIEIPASGGASINNDTEGFGWFTGVATGILPWRGPVIGFRRAALNDLFIEGSTASTNFEDMFDGTGYAGGTAKLIVDLNKIFGTALTETSAGYLAAGFKKLFDVATPVLTAASVNQTLTTAQQAKLAALADGTPSGSVVDDNDPDPTTTAFETNLAEASNDHYNGAFCVFYSGALAGQSRKISDYDGTTKVLTVAAAFTEAPAAGDDFLIIGRSE